MWLRGVTLTLLALLVAAGLAGCLGDDPDVIDAALDSVPDFIGTMNRTANVTVEPEPGPVWPHFPSDGASEKLTIEIPSFDGHLVPATVYRPLVASNETPVPVLLHSHGFTGTRATADDAFREHVAAGFGVVSFDERGHGDAQDEPVTFMHPSAEVKDVLAVIDEVAAWDWVLMDGPGDPRIGGIGGSYGGAFQLMGAVFDDRLDVIVPEITWNNIRESLAPNDAIKSGWVDLFYVAGNAEGSVVFSNDFHTGFAWTLATNELPAGQGGVVPDLVTLFDEASPSSYPGAIDIPTLLVQGMSDTLFNLNQAVANYGLISATGAPVSLYTHLGGHVLNSESLFPGSSPVPVGLQGVPGGAPCGRLTDLQIAWHLRYLLEQEDTDTGPAFCLALEDETTVSGDTWPLPGTEVLDFDVGTVALPMSPLGAQAPLELFTAEQETIVAGIPHLTGSVTSPGVDAIAYWSLWVLRTDGLWEQYVDDQAMPIRIKGPNTGAVDLDMDLGGVATRLAAGDALYLTVSNWEPMYFANAERVPGALVFDGLVLRLPVLAA